VARTLWPPRLIAIAGTAFVLSFAYQLMGLGLLSFTSGIGLGSVSLPDLVAIGVLNAILAGVAVPIIRALDLRFGETERLAW
jgi:hypothetical protein